MFTDSHCHLYFNSFNNDLPAVLDRAWSAGVERILIPGINLETSLQAVTLADQDPRIFAAVGVHPNDGATWNSQTLQSLRHLAEHPKVVAIGEIGLDFYRDRVPGPLQHQIFQAQLDLAAEMDLPVVIHNRQARADLWSMLSSWHEKLLHSNAMIRIRPGVLHSFDGSLAEARESIQRGFVISFSGPVTFKNAANLHEIAAALPLDAFLIETDAPFLTPHPHRGERNEPAYVACIAEKIANLRVLSVENIAKHTTQNAAMLFRWNNAA